MTRFLLLALALGLAGTMLPTMAASAAPGGLPNTVVYDHCSWDHPGVNPFMGDVVAAVDRYPDIPKDVRARLQARMEKRDYDDLVSIRRDSMEGRGGYFYGDSIRDMHFGTHQLCRSVSRTAWTPDMQERGLVYCDSGYCILVPTVCRNVSRITRSGVGPVAADALPLGPTQVAEADPLPAIDWFGPAGAGPAAPAAGGAPVADGPLGAGGAEGPPAAATPTFAGGAGPASAVAAPMALGQLPGAFGRTPQGNVMAVPEPGTWALLLLGLGALSLSSRRRAVGRRA